MFLLIINYRYIIPIIINDTATLNNKSDIYFIIILICNHYGFILTLYMGTQVTLDTKERNSKILKIKNYLHYFDSEFDVMEKNFKMSLLCVWVDIIIYV